jgi:hypothetical protein
LLETVAWRIRHVPVLIVVIREALGRIASGVSEAALFGATMGPFRTEDLACSLVEMKCEELQALELVGYR